MTKDSNLIKAEKTNSSPKRYFQEFEQFDLDNIESNDPYKVLNLTKEPTKENIALAWKKIIFKFHPDRFIDENNIDKLKEAGKIMKLTNWAKDRFCEVECNKKLI